MKNRGPLLAVKTKLQGRLIWLVFAAMAIPTVIFGGGALLLLDTGDLGLGSAQGEMRVGILVSIVVLFPVTSALLFCWAFYLTNRIVGPVDRLINELDARLQGTASGPVILRPKDLLLPLAERINSLIAAWEKDKRA